MHAYIHSVCIYIYIYTHTYTYIHISLATARRNNPHSKLAVACKHKQTQY